MPRSYTHYRDIVKEFLEAELAQRSGGGGKEYVRAAMKALASFNQLIIQEPQTTKKDERYREAAKKLYDKDGEVEVDSVATISYGDDDGAYVQAWVWVSKSDLPVKAKQKFPSGD